MRGNLTVSKVFRAWYEQNVTLEQFHRVSKNAGNGAYCVTPASPFQCGVLKTVAQLPVNER